MTQFLPVLPEELPRVAALRRYLLKNGLRPLTATPADLEKFDLPRWAGMFCGITCVDSPITVVDR